jgi:hypothetical protein
MSSELGKRQKGDDHIGSGIPKANEAEEVE